MQRAGRLLGMLVLLVVCGCTAGDQSATISDQSVANKVPDAIIQDKSWIDQDQHWLAEQLAGELRRWHDDTVERHFLVRSDGEAHLFQGRWISPYSWKIDFIMNDSIQRLAKEGTQTVLTHHDHQLALADSEVDILLPVTHMKLMYQSIKRDKYEWLMVQPVSTGTLVTVHMPGGVLKSPFTQFLSEHFASVEEISLTPYQLNYRMILSSLNDESWHVKRLSFSLSKQGESLEEISFRIY